MKDLILVIATTTSEKFVGKGGGDKKKTQGKMGAC